ncbi:MAG: ParB/RepB/Spo0J family partition protein [Clostridiales bacterium]|nr:ParB/RepB/Spo0J family partition protein [Clostridiales bacterium]
MAAKEKKGLGTGLDVLFGASGLDEENESELLILPISKVEPRIDQPREYFDQQALQELADSIAQYGLIQPITVRKLETGYYQIIAGERRWRASRLAGLKEVPVRVIEADDRRTAELALVENLQREDLNPIEEAKGYKTLIDEFGLTQEEAAKSVGRSRPSITNALRLLSLSPKVLEMVEKNELSAGHARALISISDDKKQLDAAKEVREKGLSVRKTEQLAAKLSKEPLPEKEEDKKISVDYAAEISDLLSKSLGRKVRLTDGKKTGKIEIEFYGADDRENLIGLLKSLGKSK